MKRFFLLLICGLTVGVTAFADSSSETILSKLRTKVRSYTSYRLDFTAAVESEGSAKGTLTVSGGKFAAKVMGQELYYDGNELWSYTPKQLEVTVERLDPANPSVLSNPSKLLNIDPADYNHRSLPDVTAVGKRLQVVELTPKAKTTDYSSVTLYVDLETGLPVRISIATPSSVAPVELLIHGMETGIPVTAGTFRFDLKTHKGVEVIDFR